MQRCLFLLLSLILSVTAVTAQPAQLYVNFYYQSYTGSVGSYPSVCSNGTLSCTASSSNFTCSSLVIGQHIYYPSATVPSFSSALSTTLPSTCEGYSADQKLPITSYGLNLQYGSSCINIYLSNATTGAIRVSPDAVSGPAVFNYSQTVQYSCPAPVAPTASGSATVGFLYAAKNSTATVCAAGTLSCSSYGSNEFVCSNLNSGTRFVYSASNNSIVTTSLGALGECASWGDGYLPLDYEGISFNTSQGCVSVFNKSGSVVVNYEQAYGSASFMYGVNAISTPTSACTTYIPGLSSANYSSAASSRISFSATALFLTLTLAGVSLLL